MTRTPRRKSKRSALLLLAAALALAALYVYLEPEIGPEGAPGAGEPTAVQAPPSSGAPAATRRPSATRTPAGAVDHLALGNPSGAVADGSQPENYLIVRPQYALGYSRSRGIPTWASWNLRRADIGQLERYPGPFITDTSLPAGWPRITHSDYSGSGFDRGHMVPSGDRSAVEADNQATFILTNVVPQAPGNNRGPWEKLESYTRSLITPQTEAYVIAGTYGSQGTLARGSLTIPEAVWKIVVVLPAGDGDAARVIAVWMPNTDDMLDQPWEPYTTSIRCIEERTGLTFLAEVDPKVRAALRGSKCGTTAQRIGIESVEPAAGGPFTDEYVLVRNAGGGAVDLSGWTLSDEAGNTYTFPQFSLAAGAEVRVWTGDGKDGARNLYWRQRQGIWNNAGDTAVLSDASGAEVARYQYP